MVSQNVMYGDVLKMPTAYCGTQTGHFCEIDRRVCEYVVEKVILSLLKQNLVPPAFLPLAQHKEKHLGRDLC